MLYYMLNLASSHSEELYNLGCYPGDVTAGFSAAGKIIFYALCVA